MSYKPTPVTAKVQKTTKGGVCNPLLNVGSVAKMKGPSVAKKKFSKDPKEKEVETKATKKKSETKKITANNNSSQFTQKDSYKEKVNE